MWYILHLGLKGCIWHFIRSVWICGNFMVILSYFVIWLSGYYVLFFSEQVRTMFWRGSMSSHPPLPVV